MSDFYSPFRVSQKRGKQFRKPYTALLRFPDGPELLQQYRPGSPAKAQVYTSHVLLLPRMLEEGMQQTVLSQSLLTGTVTVTCWPELLHQCGNLGCYKVPYKAGRVGTPRVTSCPLGCSLS